MFVIFVQDKDTGHQQAVVRLQHDHEKFVHSLKREWEQEKTDHYRSMKVLEQTLQ